MSTRSRIITAIFIVALACACSVWRNQVVATVDGEKIKASDLKAAMNMERGKYDPIVLNQRANFEEFRREALDKLTQEAILLAEAKKAGLKASPEELKEIKEMRSIAAAVREGDPVLADQGIDPGAWEKAQQKRLLIQKLIQREVIDPIPIPEGKASAYYKSHIQEFNQPAQYRARQILVNTRNQAEEILAKLKQGGDFAEFARQYSTSPDGKRGGDLGYFDASAYPPAFSEICGKLQAGETSDVVQTDYGFQIFQLLDRRPSRQISFEEASERIKQELKEESARAAIEKWAEGLRSKAKVAVNEEALKGVRLEK
ncbi:MAG: peptidyl-prolyl cis-trans isomerase [Pseudomonadota bacterium]